MKRLLTAFFFILMTVVTAKADIVFGVIPLENEKRMIERFSALTAYLNNHLDEPVILKIGRNADEIVTGLANGTIQLAYIDPHGAAQVNRDNPAVFPLVNVVKDGSPFYKSYVITKKNSSLNSPADLKGKTFAFGYKGSTASYLVPKYILAKNGVGLTDLKESKLTGSHANVLKAVLDGSVDAGGLAENLAMENKNLLKFLEISKPIPYFPICANVKALGKKKAKKIQAMLAALPVFSREITTINEKYDGFAKASIADYQIITAIMKKR